MSLLDGLRVAFDALTAHLLRTVLAMLGLIIGVGAVITLLAVGRGSQDDVARNIQSLGTNLITVRPAAFQQGVVRSAAGARPTLTYEDVQALAATTLDGVAAVSVESNTGVQIVVPGGGNFATRGIATDAAYPAVRNTPMARGEFFSADQVRTNQLVMVMGSNVANTLFGADDPTGQTVRVSVGRTGYLFTVTGVMKSQGGTALGNLDDRVMIPITTSFKVLARARGAGATNFVDQIDIAGTSAEATQTAIASVSAVLRERHASNTSGGDVFLVQSQQDALDAASGVARAQSFLLGSIAGISLIVGGIGIMNTMLVSVTERTREIGIRRAVGARQRDILLQFLVEAIMVCCLGGLLGAEIGRAHV